MRISSALLPLLANIKICLAFTTTSSLPSSTQYTNNAIQPTNQLQRLNSKICKVNNHLSVATSSTEVGEPGTADLPWSELGFEFRPTKSHLRMVYRDGKWGEAELVEVSYRLYLVVVFNVCVSVVWC